MISRKGNVFKSFEPLRDWIGQNLPVKDAILDDEGKSQFYELMFRRGTPYFCAFDLMWLDGEDLRELPLVGAKRRS